MSEHFDNLPRLVRAIHNISGDGGAAGEGAVERGRSPLAQLLGRAMGMPPAGNYPLHVGFTEHGGRETWARDFGGHRFRSELSACKGLLVERFGPIRFGFALPSDFDGLRMELRGWSVFGVPLPRWLAPRIDAREWQEGDHFRFAVAVSAPLAGHTVRYSGWLRPLDEPVPTAAEGRTPEMPPKAIGSSGNGLTAE